jgi:hypothetical protein
MAAPLIADTRRRYETQLAQKNMLAMPIDDRFELLGAAAGLFGR